MGNTLNTGLHRHVRRRISIKEVRLMTINQFDRFKGGSLVEVMIAAVVIAITVLGFAAYRYHSALDARKADMHMTAGRIGLLLCENWRGVNGQESYDPTTTDFGSDLIITASDNDGEEPEDFELLGAYKIVLNRANYYATLSWKDGDGSSTGLKALNVAVAWAQRNQGVTDIDDTDKTVEYTTYAVGYDEGG